MWFHRDRVKGDMESKQALNLARQHLKEVQARESEVRAVADAIIEFRKKNHFAEDLTALMKGALPQ